MREEVFGVDKEVLAILLKCRTREYYKIGKNIEFCTDNYNANGITFDTPLEIKLFKKNPELIKSRLEKDLKVQKKRIKEKAEVFTPSWICNEMINVLDAACLAPVNTNEPYKDLNYRTLFNYEKEKTWETNPNKINFSKFAISWRDYVSQKVIEVTCGEAPYLVSRYDCVTGEIIPLHDRIGLLDRKMRVINENLRPEDIEGWFESVVVAFTCTYGFEWQGDSLFIARRNLLYSFIEYFEYRFGAPPPIEWQKVIAEIISWNLWQTDGIKFVLPNSCDKEKTDRDLLIGQISFLENAKKECCYACKIGMRKMLTNREKHNGVYTVVRNWWKYKIDKNYSCEKYVDLIKHYKGVI